MARHIDNAYPLTYFYSGQGLLGDVKDVASQGHEVHPPSPSLWVGSCMISNKQLWAPQRCLTLEKLGSGGDPRDGSAGAASDQRTVAPWVYLIPTTGTPVWSWHFVGAETEKPCDCLWSQLLTTSAWHCLPAYSSLFHSSRHT